jgi:uncharacterized protein DUF397
VRRAPSKTALNETALSKTALNETALNETALNETARVRSGCDVVAREDLVWRRSSFSDSQAECVEVAELAGRTAVRDSKDPLGAVLIFHRRAWRQLLHTVTR